MENPIEVHPFCGRGGLVHAAGCAALSLGRGRDAHHRPGSRPGQRRQQRRAVHVGANRAPHLLLIVSPRKCEGPGGIERTTMWIATSVASWRTPLPHNTVYNHKNESVGRDAGRSPGRSSVFRRGLRASARCRSAAVAVPGNGTVEMASNLARTRKLAGSHRFFKARTSPQLAPWLVSLNFCKKIHFKKHLILFSAAFFL